MCYPGQEGIPGEGPRYSRQSLGQLPDQEAGLQGYWACGGAGLATFYLPPATSAIVLWDLLPSLIVYLWLFQTS